MAGWTHLRAILLRPGLVLLVVPGSILCRGGFDTLGLRRSVPSSKAVLPVIGVLCVGLGVSLMGATIRLFVTVVRGALARDRLTVLTACIPRGVLQDVHEVE